MTKRDRVVLARILKVHDKARFRMERAEVTWAAELEKAFGGYVNDRDSVISRTLDRLVLTPEGGIAEGAQNEALVAEMAAELEAAAGTMFDAGGVFDNSLTGASKVAERIGIRRFRDVLASADRPLDPKELKLTRAARKRINAALDTTRSEYYQGNLLNLDRFRVTFLRHINDPTSTREGLRTTLTRSTGYGDALQPILDTAGRRITLSEQADRIAKYEFPRITRNVEEQGIADRYYGGEPPPLDQQFRLWSAVGDARTQPEHLARHGHVLSIAEWNTRNWGDGRYGLPPLRPRCRCDAIFVEPDWFSKDVRDEVFTNSPDVALLEKPED